MRDTIQTIIIEKKMYTQTLLLFLERNIHIYIPTKRGGGGEREGEAHTHEGIDDTGSSAPLTQLRELLASLRSDLQPCVHTEAVPVQPASSVH